MKPLRLSLSPPRKSGRYPESEPDQTPSLLGTPEDLCSLRRSYLGSAFLPTVCPSLYSSDITIGDLVLDSDEEEDSQSEGRVSRKAGNRMGGQNKTESDIL